MELRQNGKKQASGPAELARLAARGAVTRADMMMRDSLSREIQARYGSIQALQRVYSPVNIVTVGTGYEKAIEGNSPAFGAIQRAYPPEVTQTMLLALVSATIKALGEEGRVDAQDRASIARGLWSNRKFRMLTMASVMTFFHRLTTGEIDTGGAWLRPATFLRLANQWAKTAMETERRVLQGVETRRLAEEAARREKEGMTWEQYKARHGLDPELTWEEHVLGKKEDT